MSVPGIEMRRRSSHPRLQPHPDRLAPPLLDLLALDQAAFSSVFGAAPSNGRNGQASCAMSVWRQVIGGNRQQWKDFSGIWSRVRRWWPSTQPGHWAVCQMPPGAVSYSVPGRPQNGNIGQNRHRPGPEIRPPSYYFQETELFIIHV